MILLQLNNTMTHVCVFVSYFFYSKVVKKYVNELNIILCTIFPSEELTSERLTGENVIIVYESVVETEDLISVK